MDWIQIAVLDLHLYPLYIKESVEQAYLPGLFYSTAVRGSHRSRQEDQLIILLSSVNDQMMKPEKQVELLKKAMEDYFHSQGTVTAALQKSAELINQSILDYNVKESAGGRPYTCVLNMAVRRENRLYVAQSGFTHTFVLRREETEHFYDPEGSGRGLGLSRTPSLRFFLSEIGPDEYFIFSPDPLATWNPANLSGSPASVLDYIRRRLLNQVSPNVRALLVQCQAGTGQITREAALSSKSAYFASPASVTEPPAHTTVNGHTFPVMASPSPRVYREAEPEDPRPRLVTGQVKAVRPLPAEQQPVSELDLESETSFLEGLKAIHQVLTEKWHEFTNRVERVWARIFPPKISPQDGDEFQRVDPTRVPMIALEPIRRKVNTFTAGATQVAQAVEQSMHTVSGHVEQTMGHIVQYVTPEESYKLPAISNAMMLLIAIAVPVVVAMTGSSIYFQKGRSAEFENYYQQAQAVAAQASNDKNPEEVQQAWKQALTLLDQAEKYGKTQDSITLRAQAQDVLDDVDGIARIDYASALVSGLPSSVNITKMKSTTTDLYLLDASEGKIIRALMTGRGYEVDSTFSCSPGPYGSYTVTPFVDLALMPKGNSLGASVAAIDSTGNLIYCASGVSATSITLLPPDTGWGKISGMAIDSGKLYVLDPGANTIWVYYGSSGTYSDTPEPFFDNEVPTMGDIASFDINGNDLYLLHNDGHLTTCTLASETKCKDPTPYIIQRANVENKPVIIPGSSFTQLQYASPPDPSLYILDPGTTSVYHLSLKMAVQKDLSVQAGDPQGLLKKKATAFTINPAKTVFLAFGNQVYSGMEP